MLTNFFDLCLANRANSEIEFAALGFGVVRGSLLGPGVGSAYVVSIGDSFDRRDRSKLSSAGKLCFILLHILDFLI